MRRRDFIIFLLASRPRGRSRRARSRANACGASACSWPYSADDAERQARLAAFQQALQQLGWTDGRNVRIDDPLVAGNADDIRKYAAELVALAPDVIVASVAAHRGDLATGDPHRADRVRDRPRPGRRWLRR